MKQTKKLSGSGSFQNYLLSNNASIPIVGNGATIMHYTDRDCAEVIEVSKDGKTCVIEHLDAIADTTKELGCGHQNWILKPTGRFDTITYRNGSWKVCGEKIVFTNEFKEANKKHFFIADALTDEQKNEIYGDDAWPRKVIDGITRKKKTYDTIRIIFGRKNYHYDWSF